MKVKFRISSIQVDLYYYDQIVASPVGSDCKVLKHSHLYGRMRCSIDNDRRTIIIENVTQRDTGLYKVYNNDIRRFYLNVTDQPTNVAIGENVTIDWFYSQQALTRTLRITHSNNGIMMNLPPNNEPQIVPAFRRRLFYSGDISRCYMSLTLLNIGKLDSGVYKIETIYGNTISGCKHLIVKGKYEVCVRM
ncbi:hypothetical protein CHS0354_012801 [Potamilus streckersoni]|uniref:Uncharacterized protein n=1 Tax=Potamilus streckersoni TaxID=2493646 RepID=A0AAE0SVX2_9BIVA|nr:hypothetical protein CHS0354_012801 [Potamilus streckersoni]